MCGMLLSLHPKALTDMMALRPFLMDLCQSEDVNFIQNLLKKALQRTNSALADGLKGGRERKETVKKKTGARDSAERGERKTAEGRREEKRAFLLFNLSSNGCVSCQKSRVISDDWLSHHIKPVSTS